MRKFNIQIEDKTYPIYNTATVEGETTKYNFYTEVDGETFYISAEYTPRDLANRLSNESVSLEDELMKILALEAELDISKKYHPEHYKQIVKELDNT